MTKFSVKNLNYNQTSLVRYLGTKDYETDLKKKTQTS